MHVIAAKAVSFKEALSPEFKTYMQQVVKNAKMLADTLQANGINIVSGGTDNHLMMLDLRNVNLTGKDAQNLLEEIGITANKNTIPNDPQSPFVTSGLRLGTPALTSRGFDEAAMKRLGRIIAEALKKGENSGNLAEEVRALGQQFPLYPELAVTPKTEALSHH
jgi:glycine hydroxymethyltransferase